MNRFGIISLAAALLAAGCQSRDYTHYTSPEITGRVLAADTRQPLANVSVQRAVPENFASDWSFGSPKGGTLLMQPVGARTDADGRFVLGSKSVLSPFSSPGWWNTPLVYQRAGYETFQTNYTGSNMVSHTSAGVPVLNVGDVLLPPVAK